MRKVPDIATWHPICLSFTFSRSSYTNKSDELENPFMQDDKENYFSIHRLVQGAAAGFNTGKG